MNQKLTYFFSIPYFFVALIVISIKLIGLDYLENIFKPLLLILLMIWYFTNTNKSAQKLNMAFLSALFFSLLGDVFLMPYFDNFILGLVFFLISHLFYIRVFVAGNKNSILPVLKQSPIFLIGILSIFIGLLSVLLPSVFGLNSLVLTFAVPLYALVLVLMVLSAFVYSRIHLVHSGRLVLLGGLLFLVSDSLLALNKFSFEIPNSPFWVMGTYVMAQWFIVFGWMKSK